MFDLMRPARRASCVAAAALALLVPMIAAGDAVLSSKGDTIHGHVADLTSDGVVFEPAQGKGSVAVKWEDVQSLTTDGPYTVLHGDEGEISGKIVGVEAGHLLVGDSPASAERIDVRTLFHAYDESKTTGSWVERMRSRMRFWRAALDAGAAYTDSSTDVRSGFVGLMFERKKSPTRLLFEAGARHADENKTHEGGSITESTAFAFTRGELDLTDHWYTYVSTRFTHDNELHLALRAEPRGGAGYYWVKSKTANFSTDLGLAWIYEDFFGHELDPNTGARPRRGSNDFWSVAFGAQADAVLAYGTLWRARAEYLPAVDDWQDDYLARAETSFDVPLLEWLAFKIAFVDEYDNTPAPGAEHNKFATTAGISLHFYP
jgi:Protein of unknown function, DUF481